MGEARCCRPIPPAQAAGQVAVSERTHRRVAGQQTYLIAATTVLPIEEIMVRQRLDEMFSIQPDLWSAARCFPGVSPPRGADRLIARQ
jgi:hypothetical protein